MAVLDRGFKSWAERTSASLRGELGLTPRTPLDPTKLSAYLGVTLWTPYDVPGLPTPVLTQLLTRDPSGWSAVSCVVQDQAIVIYNPKHVRGRQASDITHELAHFILDHTPGKMILSQDGSIVMRSYERKQEEEADWLSRCLLLPRDGLVWARRSGWTIEQTANHYGVTEVLVEYRLRMTGVNTQVRAARRRN